MVMDTGVDHAFLVQTDEDSMMVVVQFPDPTTGQSAAPQIGKIREMASEELGMTMVNAVAGLVIACK